MQPFEVFFMVIAFAAPLLLLWYVISTLSGIRRGIEDIAMSLRRIEQSGSRPTP